MNRPQHAILGTHNAMSPRRLLSLGLAGIVELSLIYALLSGLAQKYVKKIPPVLQVALVEPSTPDKQEIVPLKPQLVQPDEPTIAPPDIVIGTNAQAPVQMALQMPAATAATKGLNSTHTTPPYPEQERRAGVQGTVRLHIYVTAQGTVGNATVVQSSGNAELDSNAVSWVIAHWKYKPALASGQPVASETDANVKYDLKHAG